MTTQAATDPGTPAGRFHQLSPRPGRCWITPTRVDGKCGNPKCCRLSWVGSARRLDYRLATLLRPNFSEVLQKYGREGSPRTDRASVGRGRGVSFTEALQKRLKLIFEVVRAAPRRQARCATTSRSRSSLGDDFYCPSAALLCLRRRARRRGAGRSSLGLRFGFCLLFLLLSGLCAGRSWRRTRILLGLGIGRRQQRGGGHPEPCGQSCKQKYFSTRNLVFTHWQEPSLSAPPNPSRLTLKTGI